MKYLLEFLCQAVYQLVPNPRHGLPKSVFNLACLITPMINVDLVVKSPRGEILLTWRDDDNFGPGWHLPGGVIRVKETAEERLKKVAKHELQLSIYDEEFVLIHLHEHIAFKKLRGHGFSLIYSYHITNDKVSRYSKFNASNKYIAGEPAWHLNCPDNLIVEQKPLTNIIFSSVDQEKKLSKSQALIN